MHLFKPSIACYDCDVDITPLTDPTGVLYVRVVVNDELIDVAVCEKDWLRRDNRRAQMRKCWPLSVVYTCPSCGAKSYNSVHVREHYCETCGQYGQWHVEKCHYCALLLMPAVTPQGVIHVRKDVDGRPMDVAVCESDWNTRYRDRLPVRWRWIPVP
jgi:hypothetical protein